MNTRLALFTLAGTIFLGSIFMFSQFRADVNKPEIILKLPNKDIPLMVVNTRESKTRGLGGMDSLLEDSAMIFIFNEADMYGIWMKDMKFPIDILWLDENYKINYIESNISPLTYPKVFIPPTNSMYILEANAGFAENNSLKIGKVLNFSQKL